MYSKEIEIYKKRLRLTSLQKEILVGKILGDGHLESQNYGRTIRLKIEHSAKQREYVDWLYELFKEWVLTPPQFKQQKVGKNLFVKYWFQTISHGSFRFFYHQFYQEKRKKIPKLIDRWLTRRALAIWFMDDGSSKDKKRKARIINTQGFNDNDIKRLQRALETRYRIKTSIKVERGKKCIYILTDSTERFISLISPYILPSMRYKIN